MQWGSRRQGGVKGWGVSSILSDRVMESSFKRRKLYSRRAPVSVKRRSVRGVRRAPAGFRSVRAANQKIPMGANKKYNDRLAYTSIVPTTGGNTDSSGATLTDLFGPLNAPANGTSEFERVGNHIVVRNLTVHGVLKLTNDADSTPANLSSMRNRVRWVIVYDRQSNGLAPLWLDLFQSASVDTFRNLDQVDRFVVLKDKTIKVDGRYWEVAGGTTNRVGSYLIPIRFNKKLKLPADFKTSGAAAPNVVADVKTGGIYLMTIAETSLAGSAGAWLATSTISSRCKWTDGFPYN